ncbi:MAG: aminotransferase class III-fold pyridoxal phosphate-dependent enzyme [Chloroflexi bacterium]|nr:aminotransferase class III-fold pyridoxal phosphate-dependent enzyme [Chloroflexota bacterium]
MSIQGTKTKALYQQATSTIPFGVSSNFRYWGPDDTMVMTKAQGPHMWDADGKQYIDYRLGFGPVILGHAHPEVNRRVTEAIQEGTIFAWMTPLEIDICERIARMTGMDMVRLTNTGTEATMHSLRIARAHTNREKFIKYEGAYHGMCDYYLYSTASSRANALGSRRSPIPQQNSSGIPKGISQYVYTLPFNDEERLEELIEQSWHDVAALIIEPTMGNMAGIAPQPGYLEKVRELTAKYGIVLIFDEVKTGFRLANGGAQEVFGIRADMATYAKSLGNGYPIAAIAGSRDVMMTLEPGAVSHGGTYVGNVVGTAAAQAVLEILETQPILKEIAQRGKQLMDGIDEILTEADIPHCMTGLPAMFGYILGIEEPPADFRAYARGDAAMYEKIAMQLIHRGVMPDADGREPWFMCHAHDDKIISQTLEVFKEAVYAARN